MSGAMVARAAQNDLNGVASETLPFPLDKDAWVDIVKRSRIPVGKVKISAAMVKLVALACATYADKDGSRVFPGVARVATDCEITYQTATRAVGVLRSLGLLMMVSAPCRDRSSAEYQLSITPNYLDYVHVLSPDDVPGVARRLRNRHKGLATVTPIRHRGRSNVPPAEIQSGGDHVTTNPGSGGDHVTTAGGDHVTTHHPEGPPTDDHPTREDHRLKVTVPNKIEPEDPSSRGVVEMAPPKGPEARAAVADARRIIADKVSRYRASTRTERLAPGAMQDAFDLTPPIRRANVPTSQRLEEEAS